ncbi:response regulator [bacterium]|nr:response regulator [bacterium]
MKFGFRKKKKILIVDDEPDILESLSRILERAGYDIVATSDGKEVLDLAIKHNPDLIILDIVLPNISGPQIATKISEFQHLKNIPIIFITGILSQEEEERMDGVVGNRIVISKPCDPKALLKIINYKIKEAEISQ